MDDRARSRHINIALLYCTDVALAIAAPLNRSFYQTPNTFELLVAGPGAVMGCGTPLTPAWSGAPPPAGRHLPPGLLVVLYRYEYSYEYLFRLFCI